MNLRKVSLSRLLGEVATAAVAIAMIAPVVWMISTSLKPEQDVLSTTPAWIPPHLDRTNLASNYTNLLGKAQDFPVVRWFFNSLGIALTVTVLVLFISSMAAFAFARLKFKGKHSIFMAVVATMVIPSQVTLIPVFLIITKLGLFNTYAGVILPGLAGAFGVFLLRQFFLTIPKELEEAAFLDGASLWTVYSRIVVPLSSPALATLAIFTFMGSWNSFEWPLIVTNDMEMRTLPVGLSIFQGRYAMEYGLTMASAIVTTVPMLIAFLIFQRRITEGIALTGLK